MKSRAIVAALVVALATPAAAQTVVDGGTIKLRGTVYRLWGIDAPDLRQTCVDGYAAGIEAAIELAKLMAGHTVLCETRTNDRNDRTLATCRADGEDLGAAMVRDGWAWAFLEHGRDYVEQERAAKSERVGLHSHGCVAPWDWRASHGR